MTQMGLLVIGALVPIVAGAALRKIIGPWFIRPAIEHGREAFADLVAVTVMSPEVQADLRPMFEEVVASEVRVVTIEQASQGRRIERVEGAISDLSRLVRTRIEDDRRNRPDL